MMARMLWLWPSAPGTGSREVIRAGLEAGIGTLVLPRSQGRSARVGRMALVTVDGDRLLQGRSLLAPIIRIRSKADEERAARAAARHRLVVVEGVDWTIIPLENLIARFQATGSRIMAVATSAADVRTLFGVLERGVDGVILRTDDPAAVRAAAGHAAGATGRVRLRGAVVTRVVPASMGDRVCVDTCSLLEEGEGMLVGSQSQNLFLLAAETKETDYVAARPFRVNAGPVHAYTVVPGGSTKYLAELRAGDEVLAVDAGGRVRNVVVGRLKIERRPLLLVEARLGTAHLHTMVQNAETIRFQTAGGAVSVAELRPGARVLVARDEGGRHFGMRVRETIRER